MFLQTATRGFSPETLPQMLKGKQGETQRTATMCKRLDEGNQGGQLLSNSHEVNVHVAAALCVFMQEHITCDIL